MSASSLYVGNLPFTTTDEEVVAHLGNVGVSGLLSSSVAKKGQKSKGWAIVEFESPEFAASAMGLLEGTSIGDRPLLVREDRGKKERAPTSQQSQAAPRQRRPENDTPSSSLYVGNLPWELTSEELAGMFAGMQLVSCEVHKRRSGRSKGFGTVVFNSVEDATYGMTLVAGQVVGERPLFVRYEAPMDQPCAKLFVGNLPWKVEDADLLNMFSGFSIASATVAMGQQGRSRGYGVVECTSTDEAQRILTEKGAEFEYEDRTVFARFDRHLD